LNATASWAPRAAAWPVHLHKRKRLRRSAAQVQVQVYGGLLNQRVRTHRLNDN